MELQRKKWFEGCKILVVKFCLGLAAHFLAFLKTQSHGIFLRVKN
jgi:hypothetical protein